MTNEHTKALALRLLRADKEQELIQILSECGLWDNPDVWRLYGDRDGNFAIIGNQQSRPEAALVEKIVNSVDARLMNECLAGGIDPTSDEAPPSIRHAVARFFEGREVEGDMGGLLQEWPQDEQLEKSQYITLVVTGSKPRQGNPSVTVADCGEGQTPARMPDTFLSLDRDNKLRIPFVQGKFNMGGTGALKFCGQHGLQLIITRRNPEIARKMGEHDSTAGRWAFTVVRRERPREGARQIRHSVFKYLAPVGVENSPGAGQVSSFEAEELKVMPVRNRPYERAMKYGSVVKLYEYDMKGFRSHALMKDGLLSRLELLLAGIALPVRVHECRSYRGDEARSFANTLVGLLARLAENRAENLERAYPTSVSFNVHGEHLVAQVYAFKDGKADSYRTNEGIIFTINGQTHGAIPKTFFSRSNVKMGRLASSLLVLVDCSHLSVGAREDLFMNSRDRLSSGELRKAIEEELEDLIGKHPGLRELRERRRNEEIANRLEDSRPLEEILESILKSSPSLAKLFLLGQRLSQPHRAASEGNGAPGGAGADEGSGIFEGRPHPTFFRFRRKKYREMLIRNCVLGRRCRVTFETDAENEYFSRPSLPGRYYVDVVEGPIENLELDHNLTLHNGIANWSINLPNDRLTPGDDLTLEFTVTDDTLVEPFVNILRLKMTSTIRREGGRGQRESRTGSDAEKTTRRTGEYQPGGLSMPNIVKVRTNDENWHRHRFDELTACKIVEDGVGDEEDEESVFSFYVNVDNLYLRTDMKDSGEDVALREAKFIYGNVLVGLALIHESRNGRKGRGGKISEQNVGKEPIETIVEGTSRALAAFLVPMIDYLGALSADEAVGLAQAGEDE